MQDVRAGTRTPVGEPWAALGGALGVGLLVELLVHPWLFDGAPPGLGLALALVLPAAALAVALGRAGATRSAIRLAAGASLFGGFVALRASPVLQSLDVFAALALAGLALLEQRRPMVWTSDLVTAAPRLASEATKQLIEFSAVDLGGRFRPADGRPIRQLVAGVALAIPVVALFTALFVSADDLFASLVESAFRWQVSPTIARASTVVAIVAVAALAGFRMARLRPEPARPSRRRVFGTGATAVTTAVSLVAALFALFVAVQLFQLAATLVTGTSSYSEQAREGFFQLVAVGGFVVVVALVADWATRGEPEAERARLARAQRLLIALTGGVLASALVRMALYVDAFGLTELRFYTTVFMIWIAIALAIFATTVLRRRPDRFMRPVAMAAVAVLAVLNLANPDARIAQVNLAMREVDVGYLHAGLSEDAAGVVPGIGCESPDDGAGLRSWNLARWRADRQCPEE